jgi:hypothetical protein
MPDDVTVESPIQDRLLKAAELLRREATQEHSVTFLPEAMFALATMYEITAGTIEHLSENNREFRRVHVQDVEIIERLILERNEAIRGLPKWLREEMALMIKSGSKL